MAGRSGKKDPLEVAAVFAYQHLSCTTLLDRYGLPTPLSMAVTEGH